MVAVEAARPAGAARQLREGRDDGVHCGQVEAAPLEALPRGPPPLLRRARCAPIAAALPPSLPWAAGRLFQGVQSQHAPWWGHLRRLAAGCRRLPSVAPGPEVPAWLPRPGGRPCARETLREMQMLFRRSRSQVRNQDQDSLLPERSGAHAPLQLPPPPPPPPPPGSMQGAVQQMSHGLVLTMAVIVKRCTVQLTCRARLLGLASQPVGRPRSTAPAAAAAGQEDGGTLRSI